MVDGSKRRGCDVCRKRHIKCDRQSPSCTQCIRAGWTCPGYSTDLSFVNYSQSQPSARSKAVTGHDHELRNTRSSRAGTNPLASRGPPARRKGRTEILPAIRAELERSIPIAPADSDADAVRRQFVWAFEKKALPAKFETLTLEPYLKYIPAHLGRNQVLDDTVRFLALASSLPPDQRDLSKSTEPNPKLLSAYGTSVRGLANAIGNPSEVSSGPILASTLLLQLYETWCSQDNPRRVMHANAVAQMIEHRGPDAFTDDFDVAILEAEIANALFTSLRAGTCCFLATPAWSKVITEISKDKYNGPGRYDSAQLDILSIWTYLPGAVAGFHDFLRAASNHTTADSPEDARDSLSPPSLISDAHSTTSADHDPDSSPPHPSPFSSSSSPHPPPSSFTPLYRYVSGLLHRLRTWRATHLPIDLARLQHITSAGGPLYAMVCEVGSATMISICCYILATVAPTTNPEHTDTAEGYLNIARMMMGIVRGYYNGAPAHPFFASGPTRNSLKLAWVKVREDRVGDGEGTAMRRKGVGEVSERIAELVNAVYAN